MSVYVEISEERAYQDGKWGTEFDDKNTVNDWAAFISLYLGNAINMRATSLEQRTAMLKVASLAVAAIDAFDRNDSFPSRHYDKVA